MNTLFLRYALEVNKTRSITKAAQNLYMGQPNLSRAIRDLEKELGITLFERTTKGVTPTEKGRLFLERADSILSQLDDLEASYKANSQESTDLNVALPRVTYASYAFTNFLNTLERTPAIHIHFKEEPPMDAVQDTARGDADFAIIRYQEAYYGFFRNLTEELNLTSELLLEFSQLILISRSHPLAASPSVTVEDLRAYTEIVHGDYLVPALTLAEFPASAGPTAAHERKIYVYDRGSQFELLKHMAGTYMWVSPIPRQILEENNMITLPCSDCNTLSRDVIIYPKNKKLSETAQKCIDYMRAFCKNM